MVGQHIEFPDNQDVLDLIESRKPAGIFALIDEQCLFPKATDTSLSSSLAKNLATHPRQGRHQPAHSLPSARFLANTPPWRRKTF